MAVKIVLHQVRTSDANGYEITNEILDGGGQTEDIDPNLFVFRYVDSVEATQDNDTYQHVVTEGDLDDYPAVSETGWNTVGALYRRKTANFIYTDVTAADEQATLIQTRMQELATGYEADVLAWDGTDVYDYVSSDDDVQIQLTQTKTQVFVQPDDYYRLTPSITSITGIQVELFVFLQVGVSPDPATDTYTRIATVDDVETLETEGGGGSGADTYYLAGGITTAFNIDHGTKGEAEARDSIMQEDLEDLAQDYDSYTDIFEGDDTLTYNP